MEDLKNTLVVRSDLRRAPFADGSFGFIASFGVLHHLPDPRRLRPAGALLAPGGVMSLYLYSRPDRRGPRGIGLAAAAWLRQFTVRMPHPALRALCYPLAALRLGVVLPGKIGDAGHVGRLSALPMATYRDKPLRSLVLDTFDRLSAPVEFRYVWPDLAPWFEESGLWSTPTATTRAGSSWPTARRVELEDRGSGTNRCCVAVSARLAGACRQVAPGGRVPAELGFLTAVHGRPDTVSSPARSEVATSTSTGSPQARCR